MCPLTWPRPASTKPASWPRRQREADSRCWRPFLAQASDAAQALEFDRPPIDWHAFAPELVLLGVVIVLVIIDVVYTERGRVFTGCRRGASACSR